MYAALTNLFTPAFKSLKSHYFSNYSTDITCFSIHSRQFMGLGTHCSQEDLHFLHFPDAAV